MLTDKLTHVEPFPKPTMGAAGSIITDPTFNTQIMRLTDSGDANGDCHVGYPNRPVFNVNNTMARAICIQSGSNRFKVWDFNATTLVRSNGRLFGNRPSGWQDGYAQWSRVNPLKVYSVGGKILYETTINSGSTWTSTIVRDFTPNFTGTAIAQLSISDDDDVFAFHTENAGARVGYIVYKRSTNTLPIVLGSPSSVNEVEIDKSGRYLCVLLDNNTLSMWDVQTGIQTTITNGFFNHRAMGDGVVFGCVGSGSTNKPTIRNCATPNTVTNLLNDGEWVPGISGSHLSKGAGEWVQISAYKRELEGVTGPFHQEIFEVKTDGSRQVRRHVHHRCDVLADDYDAQPKACMSMDGTLVAWTSNWDGGGPAGRNDVYIARIVSDTTAPSAPTGVTII